MRLLVTRPLADAHGLVQALEARGHKVDLEPLLRITPVAGAVIPDRTYQAVLVTSANGARALADLPEGRNLLSVPVLAVGVASGKAAVAAGFASVEDADGDLAALGELVSKRCEREGGPLLYAAGSMVSGDLKGLLEAQGYTVERAVLYHAAEAEALSAATRALLAAGVLDGVLLYSPRTARVWGRLVHEAGLSEKAMQIDHFCLSRAVANALGDETGWPEIKIRVAAAPNEAALLDQL